MANQNRISGTSNLLDKDDNLIETGWGTKPSLKYNKNDIKHKRCRSFEIVGLLFYFEQRFWSTNYDRWHILLYYIINFINLILINRIFPLNKGDGKVV